jgi:hypothetical protein
MTRLIILREVAGRRTQDPRWRTTSPHEWIPRLRAE